MTTKYPLLHCRPSPELAEFVAAYAKKKGLTLSAAQVELLAIAKRNVRLR
jgi:hypothetical protein